MAQAGRKTLSGFEAALQRVLDSDGIRHSNALRRLLSYLGQKTLEGAAEDLKEYTIGVEAFGKPSNYDPQQDPAVRVLASKLRQKLDSHYLKEGADDPIRIDIPKGHYQLKFRLKEELDAGAPSAVPASEVGKWRRISLGLGIVCLLLTVWAASVLLGLWSDDQAVVGTNPGWSADLETIWQPFLESSRPVLISLGTPLFTKFSGGFFRNPKINDQETAVASSQIRGIQKTLSSPYALPWYNFTGVGEATGAFLLGRFFQGRDRRLVLKRSVVLSWDDIHDNNVIFLGSPKFNLQLKDIPVERGFVIEGGSIRNLDPEPGEQEEYGDVWGSTMAELIEDYALISRIPGLHNRGEIMVLAASSTGGTWAAVEYVTEPGYAADLVNRLRLSSGELPKSYQIVLRARFKDDVPTEITYISHRVLQE
jgi:hypothetical protein